MYKLPFITKELEKVIDDDYKMIKYIDKIINENNIDKITKLFDSLNILTNECNTDEYIWFCSSILKRIIEKYEVLPISSTFGRGIIARLKNTNTDIFLKINTRKEKRYYESLFYEYLVGRKINKLAKKCENYTITYGLFYYSINNKIFSVKNEKSYYDNILAKKLSKDPKFIQVSEYVDNIGDAENFFTDDNINIKYKIIILIQILSALTYGKEKIKLDYGDLHLSNILIKKTDKKYITYNIKNKNIKVDGKYICKFIDFSVTKVNGSEKIISYVKNKEKLTNINYRYDVISKKTLNKDLIDIITLFLRFSKDEYINKIFKDFINENKDKNYMVIYLNFIEMINKNKKYCNLINISK